MRRDVYQAIRLTLVAFHDNLQTFTTISLPDREESDCHCCMAELNLS